MATGGVLGNGCKVGFSASSPMSWTKVTQLVDIEFPSLVADDVDVTVHSTSRFKRSMPGMIEVSDMTLNLVADVDPDTSASHNSLWTYRTNGTTIWWRIEVPADRTQSEYAAFEFQGAVKEMSLGTPIEDKQTWNVVVSFDGDSFTKYSPMASALG